MSPAVAGGASVVLTLAACAMAAAGARGGRARAVVARLPVAGEGQAVGAWARRGAPAWFPPRLAAAGVGWPAGAAWRGWLGGGVAASATAVAVGGPGLGVVVAVLCAVAPAGVLAALGGRGDRLVEAALPHALEGVARALRSGASLRQGLREVARSAPAGLAGDLHRLDRDVRLGVPLVEAIEAWAARRPLPGVRLAVAALSLGAEAGGAQARAIDGVAATVRGRLALQAEVRALSSQARASAALLVAVPLLFCGFSVATNGDTADFLLRTPVGMACLVGGLLLDALAALWMARITRTDR